MPDTQASTGARCLLAAVLSLLSVALADCPQAAPPQQAAIAPASPQELKFDMRYYDSIWLPRRSARTERELAIFMQLQRLHMSQPYRNRQGQIIPLPTHPGNDSVYEQIGGSPARGFANEAAQLADIHRQLDSLKVLEHIPLTPYKPFADVTRTN